MQTKTLALVAIVMVVALILVAGCTKTTASVSTTMKQSGNYIIEEKPDGTIINYTRGTGACLAIEPSGRERECRPSETANILAGVSKH